MKNNRSIAILGGMGPQASSKLLEVMITMATRDFGAKNEADFPDIILNSIPIPNFISEKENAKVALSILSKRVQQLNNFNPACFGIACNTAHLLLPHLQTKTKTPFVSMIDEVAKEVSNAKITKVGLLVTPITIESRLYEDALNNLKIGVILPTPAEQRAIEMVITEVLSGKSEQIDSEILILIAKSLKKRGAEGIILGCTELPLIFPKKFTLPLFDSIEVLAKALLRKHQEGGDNDGKNIMENDR